MSAPVVDEPRPAQRRAYRILGLLLVPYLALWVVFAALFEPDLQFYSYYAINYDQGFVRRGLAGEIADMFPPNLYFAGLSILRWSVPVLFAASIAAVAWAAATGSGGSERRIMTALVLPMLPVGVVRAIVLPTPDLLGEAVLAVFALTLFRCRTERGVLVAGAVYGATTAVLTLVHEAIPLLQALGAVLAVVVLTQVPLRTQRLSALMAVTPGVAVAAAIALTGRRDASSQCDRLPHKPIDFPILLTPGQVLRGEHAYVDYHDWTCRFITVTTRHTPLGGFGQVGWAPWVTSTLTGLVLVALTMLLLRGLSAVPFGDFGHAVRGRLPWVITAALLLIPVFATSSDWARWWAAIAFDVGLVYLLYSSARPESARPATGRTRRGFVAAIAGLAFFPMLVGAGAATMVAPLVAQCDDLATNPQWVGICP